MAHTVIIRRLVCSREEEKSKYNSDNFYAVRLGSGVAYTCFGHHHQSDIVSLQREEIKAKKK